MSSTTVGGATDHEDGPIQDNLLHLDLSKMVSGSSPTASAIPKSAPAPNSVAAANHKSGFSFSEK
jgi:hypothetical protein